MSFFHCGAAPVRRGRHQRRRLLSLTAGRRVPASPREPERERERVSLVTPLVLAAGAGGADRGHHFGLLLGLQRPRIYAVPIHCLTIILFSFYGVPKMWLACCPFSAFPARMEIIILSSSTAKKRGREKSKNKSGPQERFFRTRVQIPTSEARCVPGTPWGSGVLCEGPTGAGTFEVLSDSVPL